MNRFVASIVGILLAGPALAAAPLGPGDIELEGNAIRRQKLDPLQGKPFDNSLWSKITTWSNGEPLTAESIKGKPVLIVSWASWYRSSHQPLRATAQALSDAHAKDGLIVVGIHDTRGWDLAAQVIGDNKISFLVGHDSSGDFLKSLLVDVNPDFYLIDRSGNLRYADIQTGSVASAVEQVLAETPEQAAENANKPAPAKGPANETAPDAEAASVNFPKPPASEYAAAAWPTKNAGNLYARDFQGKALPAAMGKEKYLTPAPSRDGRVVVLDFWATWCGPCKAIMPKLDEFYKENKSDVVVIGISDEAEGTVKSYLTRAKHSYPQAVDQRATVKNALGVQGIPHVVVLSSDGVIRWQGNPHEPNFQQTVKDVVAADPGVKARRAAERDTGKK